MTQRLDAVAIYIDLIARGIPYALGTNHVDGLIRAPGGQPQCTPAIVRACQLASGPLVDAADYWAAIGALSLRLDESPAPSSAADALVAVQVLRRFAARLGVAAHSAMHSAADAAQCLFNVAACAISVDLDPERATAWRPGKEFAAWLNRFRRESERCHGARLSERAKRLIAAEFRKNVTTAALARSLGCSATVLEREFARRWGCTPAEYRTRVRVVHALPALRYPADKVDAIAREVGWKSKKDLYRAVRAGHGSHGHRDPRPLRYGVRRAAGAPGGRMIW